MSRLLSVLLLVGCVSKGKHEITEVQLQATRTALSSRTAQGIADASEAEARKLALEEEIARRQLQLDELSARAAAKDAAFEELAGERLQLLDEIAGLEAALGEARARIPVPKPKKGAPAPATVEPSAPTAGELARVEVLSALEAHRQEEVERARRSGVQIAVSAAFAELVADGRADLEPRGEATVVRIPTALLFQEGFTTLSPRGAQIVAAASDALAKVPGLRVTVEGHTDDAPVHSAEFASNWERAFSRAIAVLRGLEGSGAALSAASFAGTRPLVPNDTEEGRARNQRVELVIETDPGIAEAFAPTPAEEEAEAPAEGEAPTEP